MKPAIVVENISKKFSKKPNKHLNYGMRDLLDEIRGKNRNSGLREDEFFAVNDASFVIYPGESFAIIGRNGCGKTTMLKMLYGLLKPDTGKIIVDGRSQALISLSAGFNPQLSGRDNIYNAAAVLGLNRKETLAIIDEVIDFAELDDFIDSPVQTYSSCMYARLGFSVAVNLKPDILLIDEILSVGDYAFQNKCFVKMHQLKKDGVTIVLVSHSHTHVVQLCERALWLNNGKMKKLGPAKETVQAYLDFLDEREKARVRQLNELKKAGEKKESLYGPIYDEFDKIEDLKVDFLVNGKKTDSLRVHDELVVEYSFRLKESVTDLNVSLVFYRNDGLQLSGISTLNDDLLKHIQNDIINCTVRIPDLNLIPGMYILVMPIHEGKSYLYRNIVKNFVVTSRKLLYWGIIDLQYDYHINF